MTNAKTTKAPATPATPAKPKPVTKAVTTFNTALEQFGSQLAIHLSSGESIHGCIETMRKTKVQLGSIKSKCQFAVAVQDLLVNLVYTNQSGKQCKLSSGAVSNYLSGIRACLKDHSKVFNKNMSREAAKAKPKTDSKGTAPEALPDEAKLCSVKVLEQIKNALVIIRADENPNFDIVAVVKLLQQASEIILKH